MARRRSLLRTAGRAAVISGAATAASGRVAQRQHKRVARENGAAIATPAAGDDLVSTIKKLAGLRDSGILTDKEFRAAKAKLLAK